jgi:phage gp46-like protein
LFTNEMESLIFRSRAQIIPTAISIRWERGNRQHVDGWWMDGRTGSPVGSKGVYVKTIYLKSEETLKHVTQVAEEA